MECNECEKNQHWTNKNHRLEWDVEIEVKQKKKSNKYQMLVRYIYVRWKWNSNKVDWNQAILFVDIGKNETRSAYDLKPSPNNMDARICLMDLIFTFSRCIYIYWVCRRAKGMSENKKSTTRKKCVTLRGIARRYRKTVSEKKTWKKVKSKRKRGGEK